MPLAFVVLLLVHLVSANCSLLHNFCVRRSWFLLWWYSCKTELLIPLLHVEEVTFPEKQSCYSSFILGREKCLVIFICWTFKISYCCSCILGLREALRESILILELYYCHNSENMFHKYQYLGLLPIFYTPKNHWPHSVPIGLGIMC